MPHSYDLIFPSHAKINLGLYVLNKRPDGYHNIWTIFQEIEFHDTLYFKKHSGKLAITTNIPSLPLGEGNLVYQAVQLLKRKAHCPEHVMIHIEKHIPLGAGLGGGSSNAAATLRGMNHLFHLGLRLQDLVSLGAELGADVPFFLYGGTALATGKGERIQPLSPFPKVWILLINPGIYISSGWAYKNVNLKLTNSRAVNSVIPKIDDVVITGDCITPLSNMLEEPVMRQYPIIRAIKAQLIDNGAEWAMMSGSGSTVFGIFNDKDLAKRTLRHMERPEWLLGVTRFL